jgi:hypothetical protein
MTLGWNNLGAGRSHLIKGQFRQEESLYILDIKPKIHVLVKNHSLYVLDVTLCDRTW